MALRLIQIEHLVNQLANARVKELDSAGLILMLTLAVSLGMSIEKRTESEHIFNYEETQSEWVEAHDFSLAAMRYALPRLDWIGFYSAELDFQSISHHKVCNSPSSAVKRHCCTVTYFNSGWAHKFPSCKAEWV